MAAYPTFTKADLVEFSGRLESDYTAYAATALKQAILLFKIGTCLKEWPSDEVSAELAKMAVLAMADAIYLVQPFQAALASPFSSESIGSYSYSKLAGAVSGGLPTGISWFDMALSQLGVCELQDNIPTGGGIEAFEHDALYTDGIGGNVRMLSPEDFREFTQFVSTATPRYVADPPSGGSSSEDDFNVFFSGDSDA